MSFRKIQLFLQSLAFSLYLYGFIFILITYNRFNALALIAHNFSIFTQKLITQKRELVARKYTLFHQNGSTYASNVHGSPKDLIPPPDTG